MKPGIHNLAWCFVMPIKQDSFRQRSSMLLPTNSPLQQRRRSSSVSTSSPSGHFWRKSKHQHEDDAVMMMNSTDSKDDAISRVVVQISDTSSSSSSSGWQQQPPSSTLVAEDDGYFPLLAAPLSLDTSHDEDRDDDDVTVIHDTIRANSSTISSWWEKLWSEMPPQSVLLLNAVAIIWGTQHAVIKLVVEDSSVGTFTLLRFALAALLASPFTPGLRPLLFSNTRDHDESSVTTTTSSSSNINSASRQDNDDDDDHEKMTESMTAANTIASSSTAPVTTAWRWGIEMGFWMFLGFAFQAVGLETTTAQRSGFLLYLNVKFVPFLARILLGRQISIPTWVSAFVAFLGTALLALSGNADASLGLSLNAGDWWSIAAAAASAMFILRLEFASVQVPSSAQLNAACLWTVTLLSLLWSVGQTATIELTSLSSQQLLSLPAFQNIWYSWISQIEHVATMHALELVYLGVVTTALANYVQTKAQKDVSAERASVIYAMDPVYGAFFSYLLLGEALTGWGIMGAALIAVAAATNAFVDFGGRTRATMAQPKDGA